MSSTKKERDFHKKVKEEVYAIAYKIGFEEGLEIAREERRKKAEEEGRKEGREEGIKEGEEKAKVEIAKDLIKLGIDEDIIMKASGFSKEEIDGLRKETI